MTITKVNTAKEFIWKRFVRLYPVFWICMILTFIITSIAGIERFERNWYEFLVNFSMIPGLLKVKAIDGVYWSLQIELFFYGFILLLYKFNLLKKLKVTLIIWILTSAILQFFINSTVLKVLFFTDFAYLFIAGICFYKLYIGEKNLIYHFIILLTIIYGGLLSSNIEFSIILFSYFIFYFVIYKKLNFLSKIKPLVFLGEISYELYLVHQFIGYIIILKLYQFGITNYFILLLIPIISSIIISWIIAYYIEKPLQTFIKNHTPTFLK
jgi:peptidoglycan/LPS O-acetylase OafA/YrhL